MQCKFSDLRRKEVVNIADGCRLGYVGDLEMQIPEGKVNALIVPGPGRFFGLFGKKEDFYIPWECIKKIGDDIVLIDQKMPHRTLEHHKERKWKSFF